jgi:hypothetical protein
VLRHSRFASPGISASAGGRRWTEWTRLGPVRPTEVSSPEDRAIGPTTGPLAVAAAGTVRAPVGLIERLPRRMDGQPGQSAEIRLPLIPKRWHGPYSTARCADAPSPQLLEGIAQFNRGEFFEQHETLEELWRSGPDDIRYLYHGILLVGVGLYHLTRGNYRGAVSKLQGGIDKLRWFAPSCQDVDVARLVSDAERCLSSLMELGPERIGEFDRRLFPHVRVVGGVSSTTETRS